MLPNVDISGIAVLCPMRIERLSIEREVRAAGVRGVQVVQTGIGREAVARAVERISAALPESIGARRLDSPNPTARCAAPVFTAAEGADGAGPAPDPARPMLILAGACGGLKPVPDVPRIERIVDAHGHVWYPEEDPGAGVTLIAVDEVVSTPEDKRLLAERSGASIVDMESHAFCAACEKAGVRWAVVRGVSDTPDETLPADVLNWITPGGDTRSARAAWDMLRRPRLIPHMFDVLSRSAHVLPQVGAEVARIIGAEAARALVESTPGVADERLWAGMP